MIGIIGDEPDMMTEAQCSQTKHEIIAVQTFFGEFKLCIENVMALQTTVVGLPGNSGSPVVNQYGHLIGVLFAGDNQVHWSDLVPLEDIKKLLSAY